MVFKMKTFINELKRRKEALIIGAGTGIVAAWYAISKGLADLGQITAAGSGLLDNVLTRSAPVDVATYKLYGVFIFLGMTLSFLADKFIIRK